LEELELDESDSVMPFTRRKSIVYETPQLNLSISELKVNFEVEQEIKSEPLNEAIKSIDDDNVDEDTGKEQAGSEARADGEEGSVTETQTHQRRKGHPANPDHNDDGERPTTSCKALSVFGEVRTVAPLAPQAADDANAAGAVGGHHRQFVQLEQRLPGQVVESLARQPSALLEHHLLQSVLLQRLHQVAEQRLPCTQHRSDQDL